MHEFLIKFIILKINIIPIKKIFSFGAKQYTKEPDILLNVDKSPITESCHFNILLNTVIEKIVPTIITII